MNHVVIIGNGISGITAARHIRKYSNFDITVISEEHPYFFSRTALMYVYMGHMTFTQTQPYENWFWEKNNINLVQSKVTSVSPEINQLQLNNGDTLSYSQLIIATGSKYNMLNWPGKNLKGVSGLYHKQDLDNITKLTQKCNNAVVVGGGLIGIELVEMLLSKNIKVTLICREKSFWENALTDNQSQLINNHIKSHQVNLIFNDTLKSIEGEKGSVKNVILESGLKIPCKFVGITIGVSPNINFIKDSGINFDKGILVNAFLSTNFSNVYAIGDCAEHQNPPNNRPKIESIWYSGKLMGETVAKTICGSKSKYKPGHWFNSAKFLDIEYQIYGQVNNIKSISKENTQFNWTNNSKSINITIQYIKSNHQITGISAIGMRLRQEVIHDWFDEKKDIHFTIKNFDKILFDPEFSTNYNNQIINKYNQTFKVNLKPKSNKILSFFNF